MAKKTAAKKAAKPSKPAPKKVTKPASKSKPVAKKAAKPAPKKAVVKKAAKPAAKKSAPKKVVKPVVKKAAPKKAVVKKAAPKKPVVKKAASKKAVAKPVVKPAAAKAPAGKKAAPKKVAAKPVAKAKPEVKKPAAKVVPAKPVKPEVVTKPANKPAPKPVVPAPKAAKPAPATKPVKQAPVKKDVKKDAQGETSRTGDKPLVTQVVAPNRPIAPPVVKKQVSTLESADKVRYSDEELAEFKELIMKKLEEARKDYDLLKQTLANTDNNGTDDTSPSFKMIEDGSETLSREETAQLAARQEKFIKHLEDALLRIRNKTYGICRVTGRLISKERLRLVPHATLSIEAKQQMGN